MKRDKRGPTLVIDAGCHGARHGAQEITGKQSSAEKGVMDEHRNLMTRGELIFSLRDVHRYWSTPRISCSEIEELERQNLIQCNTTSICAIRLTEEGALVKNGRPHKGP